MLTLTDKPPKKPITARKSVILTLTKYSGAAMLEPSRAMTPKGLASMPHKSTPIPLQCEYCGADFTPRRASDKRRFCSVQCASYWQTERLANMDPADRFWSKVRKGGPDECWEWQAARSRAGYGAVGFMYPGKSSNIASRVAWELTYGAVPDGLFVLHRCDNPPCCNPAHLFIGTHLDNVRDMHRKGRARITPPPKGDDHNKSKLTWSDVREIRRVYKRRDRQYGAYVLAEKYGVKPEAVRRVLRGETWKDDEA